MSGHTRDTNSPGVASQAWMVNSHINLATWNDIYWMDEDDITAVSTV
jgi:hypothetical protein